MVGCVPLMEAVLVVSDCHPDSRRPTKLFKRRYATHVVFAFFAHGLKSMATINASLRDTLNPIPSKTAKNRNFVDGPVGYPTHRSFPGGFFGSLQLEALAGDGYGGFD